MGLEIRADAGGIPKCLQFVGSWDITEEFSNKNVIGECFDRRLGDKRQMGADGDSDEREKERRRQ